MHSYTYSINSVFLIRESPRVTPMHGQGHKVDIRSTSCYAMLLAEGESQGNPHIIIEYTAGSVLVYRTGM